MTELQKVRDELRKVMAEIKVSNDERMEIANKIIERHTILLEALEDGTIDCSDAVKFKDLFLLLVGDSKSHYESINRMRGHIVSVLAICADLADGFIGIGQFAQGLSDYDDKA